MATLSVAGQILLNKIMWHKSAYFLTDSFTNERYVSTLRTAYTHNSTLYRGPCYTALHFNTNE